jgi:hypothetical protein
MKIKAWILGEYLGHLSVGAAMFVALLAYAGALNMLLQWAIPIVGDPSFGNLMVIVKKIIVYTDIAFIVWWLVVSTFKEIRNF